MQEFFIDSDGTPIHAKLEMPAGVSDSCPLCIVQHGLTGHMEERHILAVAARPCAWRCTAMARAGAALSGTRC